MKIKRGCAYVRVCGLLLL